jgi:hypothetical protein
VRATQNLHTDLPQQCRNRMIRICSGVADGRNWERHWFVWACGNNTSNANPSHKPVRGNHCSLTRLSFYRVRAEEMRAAPLGVSLCYWSSLLCCLWTMWKKKTNEWEFMPTRPYC